MMAFFGKQSFPAMMARYIGLAAGQGQITTDVFKAGIENGSYDLVIDVRRQDEWDSGHIPTAVHIPNETFEDDPFWTDVVLRDSSAETIVVYCRSGARAGAAIEKLKTMGYDGTLLNGMGVSQWNNAGYELTLEDESAGTNLWRQAHTTSGQKKN